MVPDGVKVQVDDIDLDLIRDHGWSLCKGYLRGHTKTYRGVYLHRVIAERMELDLPDGIEIDHEDRDRCNNHRSNLRPATKSQNGMNRTLHTNNTSGHTGVVPHGDRYRAYINIDRKRIYLGVFTHKKDAVTARRNANLKHFGEFRRQ